MRWLGVMSVVAPNMTQYAKNLEYIKEGTKKPYKTSYYSKNDWGVYKLNNNGNHVYIEYTAECIEYLKVVLA